MAFFIFIICLMSYSTQAQVTLSSIPANTTASCDANIPAGQVASSSICQPINVQLVETISNKTCFGNYTLTRTWTATDNCSNKSTATQTILITDKKAPVITLTDPLLKNFKNGDTLTMNCFNTPVFNAASATAKDNCDPNPTLIFKDNLVLNGVCNKDHFIVLMSCSWITTDDCGNKSEIQGYFKVVDNEAPIMTGVPQNMTVECSNLPSANFNPPVPVDKCDKNVKMTFLETKTNGICADSYTLKRLWTATDACGNVATAQQIITVFDKTSPVLSNTPKDVTIDLTKGQIVPTIATITAKDNCDLSPKIIVDELVVNNGCEKYLNRVWTVSDACLNTATHIQTITVIQAIPTTLATLKAFTDSTCFVKDSVVIGVKPSATVVPSGFSLSYILTKGNTILKYNNKGIFSVYNAGNYEIHSILYANSSNLDLSKILTISDLKIKIINNCIVYDDKGVAIAVSNCYNQGCTLPTLSKVLISDATCGKDDGYMILEVGPQTANFNFKWSPNVSNANAAVALKSGIYIVKITDKKDTTCSIAHTFMVGNADGPKPSAYKVTKANCNAADGSAAIIGNNTWIYTWPDGKKIDNRNDLKAGIYSVTVTDPLIPNCQNIVPITIETENTLSLTATIDKKATCNSADGQATVNVTGGSGQYTYSWGASATKSNLSAGAYFVSVTDKVSGCQNTINFVVTNSVYQVNIKLDSAIVNLACAGDTTGTVKYGLTFNSALFNGTPTIKIVNTQNKLFVNGKLGAGKYCIVVYDDGNCLAGSACFEVVQPNPLIVNISAINGGCDGGKISVSATGGVQPYSYNWKDIPNLNGIEKRANLQSGIYNLKIKDANNCNFVVDFIIKNDCNKVKKDTIYLTIDQNKTDSACVALEIAFNPAKTKYKLASSTTSSTYGTWSVSPKGCLVYKANNLVGKNIDLIGVIANDNSVNDTTCFIITIKDLVPTPCDVFSDKSSIIKAKDCNSKADFCVNIPLSNIAKYDIFDNNILLNAPFSDCNNGLGTQLNLSIGAHTIIAKVKNATCSDTIKIQVVCDTCTMQIIDFKPVTIKNCDSLFEICTSILLKNVQNYTIKDNNDIYKNGFADCGNGYTSVKVKVGIHEVSFVNKATGCEEKIYSVLVKCPISKIDTIIDIVTINKMDTVCLNLANIGKADTIFNYCPQSSGQFVKFQFINKNCVKYTGVKVGGPDYACIVICNKATNKCDTTIFKITCVKDSSTNGNVIYVPIAAKDIDTTSTNTTLIINVLQNDSLKGLPLKELTIIKKPSFGTASFINNKLEYTPDLDICNVTDVFEYAVKTSDGIDTAIICIYIKCGTFHIFNGFSPNGDGINSRFRIEGIEAFKDNQVTIFNRYGNMVHDQKRYINENGWDGTFNNIAVPDGTYWYCVDLKNGKKYFGWVQVMR